MTDEQIIEVLECCAHGEDCSNCLNKNSYSYCMETMAPYALDLINRQKAEIADLKEEIAILKEERNWNREQYFKIVEESKASKREVIKEFAERLKDNIDISVEGYSTGEVKQNIFDTIDNLAEEMTEENENA